MVIGKNPRRLCKALEIEPVTLGKRKTGHEPGDNYAQMTFSRLVANGSEHAKEVTTNCCDFQFPGQGQKSTPCMTLRGLQRLLLILGGKVASQYREIVESVFTGRSRR